MGSINWSRVFLGGIVAGVIIGVFNAILIPIQHAQWSEILTAQNAGTIEVNAMLIVNGALMQFGLGITAVWLYAAIRPRFGAGPKTAVIAGFVVWLVAALAFVGQAALTAMTFAHVAILHGPGIVTLIIATLAGAWVYREPAGGTPAPG